MGELTDATYAKLTQLTEEGNALADASDIAGALKRFRAAWQILPEPRLEWDAALWLLASIGDMEFQLGHYKQARDELMSAVKSFEEAPGNPFIRLRLGQTLLELGEDKEAASWLAGAYVSEGKKIFENEDPKYLAFIKPQLKAPPGGWPEGW
jgi:tetratricopeptide (TPR) repeat protein